MDTPVNGALLIGAAMVVAVMGLLLVRRFVDIAWLKQHHEVASYFFLMIGTSTPCSLHSRFSWSGVLSRTQVRIFSMKPTKSVTCPVCQRSCLTRCERTYGPPSSNT